MPATTWEDDKAHMFATMEERKEFFTDVSGYIYWWPHESTGGFLSSHQLRAIADELDRRNKPFDDEVQAFFASQEKPR